MEETELLLKALKVGYVLYPLDCQEDCYQYKVECLYYNKNMQQFYIYASDGVGELFAKDYEKTWRIVE